MPLRDLVTASRSDRVRETAMPREVKGNGGGYPEKQSRCQATGIVDLDEGERDRQPDQSASAKSPLRGQSPRKDDEQGRAQNRQSESRLLDVLAIADVARIAGRLPSGRHEGIRQEAGAHQDREASHMKARGPKPAARSLARSLNLGQVLGSP